MKMKFHHISGNENQIITLASGEERVPQLAPYKCLYACSGTE